MTKNQLEKQQRFVAIRAFEGIQSYVQFLISEENRKRSKQKRPYPTPRSEIQNGCKSYPFIPINPEAILRQLIFVHDYATRKLGTFTPSFLDAGCGPGNVMILAAAAGFTPWGLEFDPVTVQAAKPFNRHWRNIKQQNILTYRSYGKFDVIYYYCPISGPLQTKFEERVEDQMKVGALLIPHLKRSQRIMADKRFKIITVPGTRTIYEKVKK